MLRSKDTWGECNEKYDENYFGSFTTKKFKNHWNYSQSQLVSYSASDTYSSQGFDRNRWQYLEKRQNMADYIIMSTN